VKSAVWIVLSNGHPKIIAYCAKVAYLELFTKRFFKKVNFFIVVSSDKQVINIDCYNNPFFIKDAIVRI
jgi:hypothetical protein